MKVRLGLLVVFCLASCGARPQILSKVVVGITSPQCQVGASDDSFSVSVGQPSQLNVIANDTANPGLVVLTRIVTPPSRGTAVLNTTTGIITYTANPGTSGADSFVYEINSTVNCQTRTATVTLNIQSSAPANRPPVAVNDTASVVSAGTVNINVLANDSDPDTDPLTVTSVSTPALGNASIVSNQVRFIAPTIACGTTRQVSFNYTISDPQGDTASAAVTVSVSAAACPNQPPVAVNDTASVASGGVLNINVLANDLDPEGGLLLVSAVTQPAGPNPPATAEIVSSQVRFVAPSIACGTTAQHTFNYTISDPQGDTASASVAVTINGASCPGSSNFKARSDFISVNVGQSLDIDVLANDERPSSTPVGLDWVTPTSTGTLALLPSGLIRYTAPGTDSVRCGRGRAAESTFYYQARNPLTTETSMASVNVQVVSTQDCPPEPNSAPTPPTFIPRQAYTPGQAGLSWCNPGAWPGGQVPANGAAVMIPAGTTIRLDCMTNEIGALHIHGALEVPNTSDATLRAASIHIMGQGARLQVGSHSAPYPRSRKAIIELTGARPTHSIRWPTDNALDNDGQSRAIHVMNQGALVLVSETPSVLTTRLAEDAPAGATQIRVRGDVTLGGNGWRVGDVIAVAHNDFWRTGTHEILRIVSPAPSFDGTSTTISLESMRPGQTGLISARFGRLQYPTDQGLGLTPGVFTPPSSLVPTVLDESPHVSLLTRSIVIQGKDDTLWRNHGWGFHTMVMHQASDPWAVPTYILDGVELNRAGQANTMARYPIHTHMLSYQPGFIDRVNRPGQPTNVAILRNAIWESTNRAITIHGTSNVPVEDNIAVDIMGHAVFLEDGSETGNQLIGNVVMGVRPCDTRAGTTRGRFWRQNDLGDWGLPERGGNNTYIAAAQAWSFECHIKRHEQWGENGASAFWITHPDNWFDGNVATGARVGIWNSFSDRVFGLSAQMGVTGPGGQAINPSRSPLRSHRHNTTYSNLTFGMRTSGSVMNEAGDIGLIRFEPPTELVLHGNVLFKNDVAYDNRVKSPRYTSWTVADNRWGFAGATDFNAELSDLLIVGKSLHNANPIGLGFGPMPDDRARVAMSSYHHQLKVFRMVAFNFEPSPVVMGEGISSNQTHAGGVFGGIDLYLWPSNRVGRQNTQWKFINAFPGFLTLPGWFDTFNLVPAGQPNGRYFGIGSSRDIFGDFYPERPGMWLMPDASYFTYGMTECDPNNPNVHPEEGTCDFKRIAALPGQRYRVATHRVPVGIAKIHADGVDSFYNHHVHYRRLSTSTLNGVVGVPAGASSYIPASPHPLDGRNLSEHQSRMNSLSLIGTDFTEVMEGAAVRLTLYNSSNTEIRPTNQLRLTFEAGDELPPGKHVILALPWGGAVRPSTVRLGHAPWTYPTGWDGSIAGFPSTAYRDLNQNASSLSDLVAQNPEGRKVLFDPQNGVIWVKIMSGLSGGPFFADCQTSSGTIPNQTNMSEHCMRSGTSLYIAQ